MATNGCLAGAPRPRDTNAGKFLADLTTTSASFPCTLMLQTGSDHARSGPCRSAFT